MVALASNLLNSSWLKVVVFIFTLANNNCAERAGAHLADLLRGTCVHSCTA